MAEFDVIRQILDVLGVHSTGEHVRLGPGDDGAITRGKLRQDTVSSIDTLVADVHFPRRADAALVGYRAMQVSASDLAAMGASPGYALVALTLPDNDTRWARRCAHGIADAAAQLELPVVGGNLARGEYSISVSVHGLVPLGSGLLRSGGKDGDALYVTGSLGAASAALKLGELERCVYGKPMDALQTHYFAPQARIGAGIALRGVASAAIDVSDGLLQDIGHLCTASNLGVRLYSDAIPSHPDAGLQEALVGGDDYELVFATAKTVPELGVPVARIGELTSHQRMLLDGRPVAAEGFDHFRDAHR
ncbi:MAG: thiamine-phosphate kinase [Pseudomonadota bacterium]